MIDSRSLRALRLCRAATLVLLIACTGDPDTSSATPASMAGTSQAEANAGIDSLNARIERAYREKNARAYAELYTDSAVFEWPAVPTVRGRAGLEAMARELWPPLPELDLRLIVSSRRIAAGHATEHGAFEESWRDSTGGRKTEYGRYVVLLARQPDLSWRMDRFFGFSDSSRTAPARK
jgi:ketosteroid isomerase-like protein